MRKTISLCLTLFAALSLGATAPVMATSKHKKATVEAPSLIPAVQPFVATYDVYVGGFHMLTVDILFQESAHTYSARVDGRTSGFWYKIFPWDTQLAAQGKIASDRFLPVDYTTHDLWGKKAKSMKMHFGAADVTSEYQPPEQQDKNKALTPDQKQGALDPVSALLQMLAHLAVANDCNVTVPVYDGKRRFDVIANDVGSEDIDEDDYGLYKGVARTCDAHFKAVAGEWSDKLKQRFWQSGKDGGDREPFHIWLAQVDPALPQLAVRVETGSAFGDIIVHLSKWRPATPDDISGSSANPAVKPAS